MRFCTSFAQFFWTKSAMKRNDASPLGNLDIITFSIFIGLVMVGWLMVYTVSFGEGYSGGTENFFSTSVGKQTIWVGASFFMFAFILLIDWKFWQTFAYPIYAFSLFLLVAVLFLGKEIKGATSWFSFGGFSFQPSELAKFGTCLAMSVFLSHYSTNLRTGRSQIYALSLLLAPMFLIMRQPDAGSALVFMSFLVVLYREGLSPNYFIIGGYIATMAILGLAFKDINSILFGLILLSGLPLALQFSPRNYWLAAYLAASGMAIYLYRLGFQTEVLLVSVGIVSALAGAQWFKKNERLVGLLFTALIVGVGVTIAANYGFNNVLKPHQQDRINVWLNPDASDAQGSKYNLVQSQLAISSGGFWGKGFTEGTMTKLNYVPEQSTDFIFCTIGEEEGFIGTFSIIILFLLLLIRITILAERQRANFSRHYAYCVAGIFFIHFLVNIGMTMGLMPIIGIPLPLISKGGSSLLGFTMMVAVLLKLDSNRYRI